MPMISFDQDDFSKFLDAAYYSCNGNIQEEFGDGGEYNIMFNIPSQEKWIVLRGETVPDLDKARAIYKKIDDWFEQWDEAPSMYLWDELGDALREGGKRE